MKQAELSIILCINITPRNKECQNTALLLFRLTVSLRLSTSKQALPTPKLIAINKYKTYDCQGVKMSTSSAIKMLDGKTRAVYKDGFLESDWFKNI